MRTLFLIAAALMILVSVTAPAQTESASDAHSEIDFLNDVYPIFERRCLRCHGSEQSSGALRLDRHELARRGGHTGSPILGGDVSTNTILLRVTTKDESIRMPKEGPPLTPEEQVTIRRWVESGTPWTDPPDHAVPAKYSVTWETLQPWDPRDWSNARAEELTWWFWRFGTVWIVLLLGIGFCDRCRYWVQTGSPQVESPDGGLYRALAAVPRSAHLAVMLGLLSVCMAVFYQRQTRRADQEVARLKGDISNLIQRTTNVSAATPDGDPRPVHPGHPPRLGGEYYRGNDERNEKLFNGGFYRTCVMRVWLCRGDGTVLAWGDAADPSELFVRFEIEQSPEATDTLFSTEVMQASYVSSVAPGKEVTDATLQIAALQPDGERRWTATIPIDLASEDQSLQSGLLYLCRGEVPLDGGTPRDPHYAAEYSLAVVNGCVSLNSELWLGYIYRTGNVVPVPEGKIAEDEWFSFRPIPEIEGAQTTDDPELLGIK